MAKINLYSALVTVDCGDRTCQTGWFISEGGHLLTSAHGLIENSRAVGDIVTVVRQNNQKRLSAKIIELGITNSSSLDYAILEVITLTKCVFPCIPVLTKWSPDFAGMDFNGGGYSDAIGGTPTEIDGRIVSRNIRPSDGLVQLSIQTPFNADGLSGSPIIVSKYNKAIALQSAQPNATESMLLAIPLSCITKHSKVFRGITDAVSRNDRKWDVFQLDAQLIPTPKSPKREVRVVYCLHPSDPKSHGGRLLEYLQEHWNTFTNRVRATCISVDPSLKYVPELVPKFHLTEAISPKLDIYFDQEFIGAPVDIDKVRCVCDLSQEVDMKTGNGLPSVAPLSHLVGVAVGEPSEGLHETRIRNLDCWFSLPVTDARRFATCLFDIIEDMLVDSTLFYSTRILSNIYNTIELKKSLSECKADYASECGLSPYGISIATKTIRYVSLSSCCRSAFGAPLDLQRLREIWHNFVDVYLLRSLQPREKASTPKVPMDLVFERIVQTPKIAGQINRRILHRDLERFRAKDGELCAVVLLRKQASGPMAKKLQGFFRVNKLRPNRPRLCRQDKLPSLLLFRRYVDVFLFRWREPNSTLKAL